MSQQKALFKESPKGAWVIKTTDIPKPQEGEVLVKIHSTGLNPIDWKIVTPIFDDIPLVDSYPAIFGHDSAGTVEEVGKGVKALIKGDRVIHQGQLSHQHATFQQYTIVPAELAAKIPNNISFDDAASLPLALATAVIGLYNPADKRGAGLMPPWEIGGEGKYKGRGLFILGGSSSVGKCAIQCARLSGFSPIVTTSSLRHSELLKSLGATHVLSRDADLVSEAKRLFSTPPQIVFDAISTGETQMQGWNILASDGQLLIVLPVSPSIKQGEDGKKIVVVYGSVHLPDSRELGRSLYAKLSEALELGKIKPNRVEVLSGGLAGIEAGLKRLQENTVSGVKLVVRPQETA